MRLLLWRGPNDRHGGAQLHYLIHRNFDIIRPCALEFHLPKDSYIGGMKGRILQSEFHFAFAQNRDLIRPHQPNHFCELFQSCRPAIEQAQFQRDYRHLRYTNEIDDTDQKKVSRDFLADFFAQKRALQVRKNAGRLHEVSGAKGHFSVTAISAARTVFCISIAIVIGPTPPGLGVMLPAIGWTPAKSTSPTKREPLFAVASLTRFTPTSTTTAPGLTISAFTNSATPIAAIKISARRQCPLMSRVAE